MTITSHSLVNGSASSSNGSGGLVAVGIASASIDIDDDNSAYIGNGTVIDALGLLSLTADLDHVGDITVNTNGGGFVDVSDSGATLTDLFSNRAEVQDGAQVSALGAVSITADTNVDGDAYADADASGGGAGSNADSIFEIETGSLTEVEIGANARIVSRQPGRIVVNIDARKSGTFLQLRQTDPANPRWDSDSTSTRRRMASRGGPSPSTGSSSPGTTGCGPSRPIR